MFASSVGRCYSSWADDLAQLCQVRDPPAHKAANPDLTFHGQELNLGSTPVGILGYSSGGPNSMAAATLMPKLGQPIGALGLISTDAPYGAMGADWVKRMYGEEVGLKIYCRDYGPP